MKNEDRYNIKNYVLTMGSGILRGTDHETYVTVRAKTDPTMSRCSESLIIHCRENVFTCFLDCLANGAELLKLSGYLTSLGAYTKVSIYDETTKRLIGSFCMDRIIFENRKDTAGREDIKRIHYILSTLYRMQKQYDLPRAFIPDTVPDNPGFF